MSLNIIEPNKAPAKKDPIVRANNISAPISLPAEVTNYGALVSGSNSDKKNLTALLEMMGVPEFLKNTFDYVGLANMMVYQGFSPSKVFKIMSARKESFELAYLLCQRGPGIFKDENSSKYPVEIGKYRTIYKQLVAKGIKSSQILLAFGLFNAMTSVNHRIAQPTFEPELFKNSNTRTEGLPAVFHILGLSLYTIGGQYETFYLNFLIKVGRLVNPKMTTEEADAATIRYYALSISNPGPFVMTADGVAERFPVEGREAYFWSWGHNHPNIAPEAWTELAKPAPKISLSAVPEVNI
jgi:hypothetical protein